ncbi:MAG: AAA family ATPase, partial [Candidatus Hydrothermarchaeales archaeon]
MKLVVGLVGRIGSGKGVVSEHLHEKYGASQHRFSQVLMDLLDRLYLPHDREYLQDLGACIRNTLGMEVIVDAFKRDLESDDSDIIVVDGIRYENEVEMLRSFENNLLIFIDAPPKLRYERCRDRGEKGEAGITFEEFLEAE